MTPFLCAFAVWLAANSAVTLAIHGVARRRVGVSRKLAWSGLAMSLVVLVIWAVTFMAVLIAADQSGTRATNGELVTSCALWSAVPMVLTLVLQIAGTASAMRAPRRP
jgi:hypothetical protein